MSDDGAGMPIELKHKIQHRASLPGLFLFVTGSLRLKPIISTFPRILQNLFDRLFILASPAKHC
ncbi:Uncharacterised protein [Yersinia frederiksenii]|nr:Uncharacterised protein [Yersinia frederiksenii]CNL69320.1 Uncharacterised protein [Yersinia frederiksenii]